MFLIDTSNITIPIITAFLLQCKVDPPKENVDVFWAQLPSGLFSPSDTSKKLSHHFLLHFPIAKGSYNHHRVCFWGFYKTLVS